MEDVNKWPRNFVSLCELGYMWLFIGILLQESSPTFDKVSELVTKLVSCYVHDPYFITFGHVFLDKNLGLVDSIYQRYGNSRFWNLISLSRAKFKIGLTRFSQNNQVLLLTTPENTITYHNTILLVTPPKFCISTVFQFLLGPFNSQEKLKTMLMQNFGRVTNKQYYD